MINKKFIILIPIILLLTYLYSHNAGIIAVFIIFTFIIGSIPNGVWIGKTFKNIDIRNFGSKNSGATNAYRILGAKYGIIVLILDALKGYIPLMIASHYGINVKVILFLALIAILGHTFSPFLNFKGGKGVATGLGVFLFLMPKVMLVIIILFILIVSLTKYISLASIICAIMLPILSTFMPIKYLELRGTLITISLIAACFVVYKHKTNIERLLHGKENKFKFK